MPPPHLHLTLYLPRQILWQSRNPLCLTRPCFFLFINSSLTGKVRPFDHGRMTRTHAPRTRSRAKIHETRVRARFKPNPVTALFRETTLVGSSRIDGGHPFGGAHGRSREPLDRRIRGFHRGGRLASFPLQ